MSELLQRPPIQPGEWWDGYVLRVLAANGLKPSTIYMQRRLKHYVDDLVTPEVKHASQAGIPAGENLLQFSDHVLPSWAVRGQGGATAFCPECFRESPYIPLSWRLRGATRCHKHDHLLRTNCWSCNRKIFPSDLIAGTCACGADYLHSAAWSVVSVPRDPQRLPPTRRARPIKGKTYDAGLSLPFDTQGTFDSTSIALVAFLGCLLPSLAISDINSKDKSDGSVSNLLKRLNLDLEPTLEWIDLLWKRLDCATHLRCALGVILSIRDEEKNAPSVLSTLPLWEWAQALSALGASPLFAERKGWICKGELTQQLIPAGTVMQQTRISGRHLHDLMSEGVVVPVRTLTWGLRQHLFSLDQLEKLKSYVFQGRRYGKAIDLGIEGQGMEVMAEAGIVGLTRGGSGRSWLDRIELARLFEELDAHAEPLEQTHSGRVCLGSRRIWQRPFLPVLQLMFDRLRRGDLRVWRYGDSPGLARFYIGPDSLEFLQRFAFAGCRDLYVDNSELPLYGADVKWRLSRFNWHKRPVLRGARESSRVSTQMALPLSGAVCEAR